MITKTRKTGNSVILTVPSTFKISEGTAFEPEMTSEGIFYRLVKNDDDNFFDFDKLILKDLISQGFSGNELLEKFSDEKDAIKKNLHDLLDKSTEETTVMSREEFEREIGL
ncbi:AbrB family transcriptional regulator [Bacilli bacterium]|nr:AbrB family transcriptional regulator [Bacilli bacterium]